MTMLQNAQAAVAKLTRDEKAALVQDLVRDLGDVFPGIESRPDVLGGEPCVVRTRIPVWVLEQARRLGAREADLLGSYPTLRTEDILNAWAYAASRKSEIDAQIRDNEAA